jgi:hypothetical protein
MRQTDIEADTSPPCFGGAAVRCLHDARAAAGANNTALQGRLTLTPLSDETRELNRVIVEPMHWAAGVDTSRTEENDRAYHACLGQNAHRLHVFGENAQGPRLLAI